MYEASRFSKVSDLLRKDTVKAMRMMELILPILLFVMNASFMAVLWFGAIEVRDGGAQVGELVAIVNYAMRMTGAFSMFSFIIVAFSRAKASSERMEEVLLANEDLEIHTFGKYGTVAQLKAICDLKMCRSIIQVSSEPILDNVSFHVSPGEKLAIMGATGSGKSTLLNLIPRIFEATEGNIYVSGTEVEDWPLKDLRDTIGLVPQQSILFTGSILENLSWGDTEAHVDELEEAAKKAQIHESIDLFPQNMGHVSGRKVSTYRVVKNSDYPLHGRSFGNHPS